MQNILGKILLYSGFIVIVIGILLSIIMASNRAITTDYGIEYVQVDGGFIISLFIGHIVIGLILIGLSEIIKLLQELVNKQNEKDEEIVVEESDIHTNEQSPNSVSNLARAEIMQYYAAKGIQIEEVYLTNKEDIYSVMYGDKQDLVELGGFSPRIIKQQ
ncbi:hypothetical protein [Paenisporosarcina quisquiliarum]|uniref:hypothetical protein n=1 Tax=Paenisporosarcina quisquiliarum TaxID=365346 RepID=UPI003734DF63